MPDHVKLAAPGGPASPSSWVMRWADILQPGALVLDFASGSGRNALALAARGCRVVAADRDAEALTRIDDRAVRVQADLEAAPWPFEVDSFDAVVVCNFLHRPRLDALFSLVRPGGIVIYETFAQGNERFGRPANPAFLLAPGELLAVAQRQGFEVLGYEHGLAGGQGGLAMVQRLCAVRPPFDAFVAPVMVR